MSNSLSAVHPELVAEWSEKNLPLTPDNVTFGSNKKVWWKGTCGHEWETSIKARSSGEKCPICSGARVIEGINDLSTLKPELASEWSEKNEIKPTDVSIGSHKKVIWKCKLGHEWIATVKSRTINKTGCPYCSHNKVLAGFNDLAALAVVGGALAVAPLAGVDIVKKLTLNKKIEEQQYSCAVMKFYLDSLGEFLGL